MNDTHVSAKKPKSICNIPTATGSFLNDQLQWFITKTSCTNIQHVFSVLDSTLSF